jgi:hypothetical protein
MRRLKAAATKRNDRGSRSRAVRGSGGAPVPPIPGSPHIKARTKGRTAMPTARNMICVLTRIYFASKR